MADQLSAVERRRTGLGLEEVERLYAEALYREAVLERQLRQAEDRLADRNNHIAELARQRDALVVRVMELAAALKAGSSQ